MEVARNSRTLIKIFTGDHNFFQKPFRIRSLPHNRGSIFFYLLAEEACYETGETVSVKALNRKGNRALGQDFLYLRCSIRF